MTKIFSQTYNHLILSLSAIGDTIAGNRVDVITITGKQPNKNKKTVWIIGRQHPG
jgi:murein tripeptide amidase MpaA